MDTVNIKVSFKYLYKVNNKVSVKYLYKVNNKVSVKYLYKEKLPKLGENFFGATKRASVLNIKIFPKPDVASGMDQYIHEQVENGNYVEINPSEARLNNHQHHFVGYNFVVLSTSSSFKVRMPPRHSSPIKMSYLLLCVWY